MALPYQIGDGVLFQSLPVQSIAKPLVDANEAHESVIGIYLKADPGNAQTVYIGDSNSQPYPLAAGEGISFRLSRRNKLFYKGTAPDKLIAVLITTSGNMGRPYGVRE